MTDSLTPQVATTTLRRGSPEERRRLVAASLHVGNPSRSATELPERADPAAECQIELEVDAIRSYEGNPRRVSNAKFAEIKESIRASGILNPLTVTRRPGDSHYVVESGGNTRLAAIQQLWAETADPRFQRIVALYRPWQSEAHVLTAHLIENEQRGDMTFWDKATGVVSLKSALEQDAGQSLSLRQLEQALAARGLAVNTATLALYISAQERLGILGEGVPTLSGLDVKTMQPRLNALKRYAQAKTSASDDDIYEFVFQPVFRASVDTYRTSRQFSAVDLCNACEKAIAAYLGESVDADPTSMRGRPRQRPAQQAVQDPTTSSTHMAGAADGKPVSTADNHEVGGESAGCGHPAQSALQQLLMACAATELVHPDDTEPGGCRLLPRAGVGTLPEATEHAWDLLALATGYVADVEEGRAAALLRWLLTGRDAGACAARAYVAVLRDRGAERGPTASTGSAS